MNLNWLNFLNFTIFCDLPETGFILVGLAGLAGIGANRAKRQSLKRLASWLVFLLIVTSIAVFILMAGVDYQRSMSDFWIAIMMIACPLFLGHEISPTLYPDLKKKETHAKH